LEYIVVGRIHESVCYSDFSGFGYGVLSGYCEHCTGNSGSLDPFKLKLVEIIFKNPVRTSKRTPHFSIRRISWLMLFK
jgi:hypothetical protein